VSPSENGTPAQLPAPTVPDAHDLPPALTSPPGVESLLATIRRRWPLILGLGIVASAVAFALVWFLVPGRYASVLVLGINPRNARGELEGEIELATFSRMQQAVIKSSPVLRDLLTRVAVGELRETQDHGADPSWLRSALVIDQPPGAGFETIRVTLQGDYPDDVAIILNELSEVYLKRQTEDAREQALNRVEQVSRQLTEVKGRWRPSRRRSANWSTGSAWATASTSRTRSRS
jgi:capsular polysaccharide biosynthesis protein